MSSNVPPAVAPIPVDLESVPTRVWVALSEVCGYHEGDPCDHCAESVRVHRGRGWSWDELLEDVRLYRDDYRAWERKVRASAAARSAAREEAQG
jgi:hypothetical protein